jgi:hypothetical protein
MQKCPEVGMNHVPTQKEIDAANSYREAIERYKEGYTEEDKKPYDESVHTITDEGDETGSKPEMTHKKPSNQQPGQRRATQTQDPATEAPLQENPPPIEPAPQTPPVTAPAPEVAAAPAPADNATITKPKAEPKMKGNRQVVVRGDVDDKGNPWRERLEIARDNAILNAKKAGYVAAVAATVLGYILLGIVFFIKSSAAKRRMQEFRDTQARSSQQDAEKKLGESDLTFEPSLHTHVTPDDLPSEMADEEAPPRDIAANEEDEDLDSEDDD